MSIFCPVNPEMPFAVHRRLSSRNLNERDNHKKISILQTIVEIPETQTLVLKLVRQLLKEKM